MAWNAAMSIEPDELEALELALRHDMDLSLVLGLPPAPAEELLDRAKQNLERGLGAEVLIRRNYDCPARAEVMSGWTGVMTASIRDRVLEHASDCPDCGPNLPRNVSAARVFTLLPAPAFSTVARLEVLKFIADPRLSAYREFAVSRASEFNAAGFPVMPAATAATTEAPAGAAFDVFAIAPKPAAEVPVPAEPPTEEIPVALAPVAPAEAAKPAQAPAASAAPAPPEAVRPPEAPALAAVSVAAAPAAAEVPMVSALVLPAPTAARKNTLSAPAGQGRKEPPPAARRRRMSGRRVIVAGAGALAVTTLFAVLGFSGIPTVMRASGPTIAPSPSASASALAGGGADVTIPVKVKRPGSVRSSLPPVLHGTTRTEALAVAATLPVTSSQAPVLPSAAASLPAASLPAATLTATPDSLTLDSPSAGTITLTAAGGPVSWTASASSSQASLSSHQGTLKPGQSVTITVSVPAGSGSAIISIGAAPAGSSAASSGSSTVMTVPVSWSSRSASGSGSGSGPGSTSGPGSGSGSGSGTGSGTGTGTGTGHRPRPPWTPPPSSPAPSSSASPSGTPTSTAPAPASS